MKPQSQLDFSQLCRNEVKGFVYDEKTIIRPQDPENYDEVVFKIITKCDTNLLLLESHKGNLESFTIEIVELDQHDGDRGTNGSNFWSKQNELQNKRIKTKHTDVPISTIIEHFWLEVEEEYDGLITLGLIDPQSMPNNECREKYTLGQFVEHVWSTIESYYMFHKPNKSFNPSIFKGERLSIQEDNRTYNNGYAVIMLWKIEARRSVFPKSHVKEVNLIKSSPIKLIPTLSPAKISPSLQEPSSTPPSTIDIPVPKTVNEMAVKKKNQNRRKSCIMPEWPEEEKLEVLEVFDNLNPEMPETTQIALICKYATIQFDRELPSKLLYTWVQKKGRTINRTVTNFDIGLNQAKQSAIEFYRTLNEDQIEGSRVSFVIKYFKAQFNISITSKELISWISQKEKPIKATRGVKRK